MEVNKCPKLCGLTAFSLMGWLSPLAFQFSPELTTFSLTLSLASSAALVRETNDEAIVSHVRQTEKKLGLERIAYEIALRHERELEELKAMYGFCSNELDHEDNEPTPHPQLEGGYIGQSQLGESGENVVPFDLRWLLESNSQHLLVTGPTGAGKTTFVRWVCRQFEAKEGKVYDPDYAGEDWGFPVVQAPMEDYAAIRQAMKTDLSEFGKRTPNNASNPKTIFIVEEMPSTIPECGDDGEQWLKILLRRGRKRNLFVIGVSQDRNAETFKIKNASPLLQNFTILYLGGYAFDALDRIRDRSRRSALRGKLSQAKRPALVQWQGQFYFWDVPDLSAPQQTQTQNQQTTQPAPVPPEHTAQADPIGNLTALLSKSVDVSATHWAIVDFALKMGRAVSTREAMRGCRVNTAEECKRLFMELQGLELGKVISEGDRMFFRAYQPLA